MGVDMKIHTEQYYYTS